eukprot:221060_1
MTTTNPTKATDTISHLICIMHTDTLLKTLLLLKMYLLLMFVTLFRKTTSAVSGYKDIVTFNTMSTGYGQNDNGSYVYTVNISTGAGETILINGGGHRDGCGINATLGSPKRLCLSLDRKILYIADNYNNTVADLRSIRALNLSTNCVSTIGQYNATIHGALNGVCVGDGKFNNSIFVITQHSLLQLNLNTGKQKILIDNKLNAGSDCSLYMNPYKRPTDIIIDDSNCYKYDVVNIEKAIGQNKSNF